MLCVSGARVPPIWVQDVGSNPPVGEIPKNGFHHWEIRRMVGMVPKRHQEGTWVYPPIGASLEMVGLEEIGVSIARRHNTVEQYISTHIIMDSCLAAERNLGMGLTREWWEQLVLDILRIRPGMQQQMRWKRQRRNNHRQRERKSR